MVLSDIGLRAEAEAWFDEKVIIEVEARFCLVSGYGTI